MQPMMTKLNDMCIDSLITYTLPYYVYCIVSWHFLIAVKCQPRGVCKIWLNQLSLFLLLTLSVSLVIVQLSSNVLFLVRVQVITYVFPYKMTSIVVSHVRVILWDLESCALIFTSSLSALCKFAYWLCGDYCWIMNPIASEYRELKDTVHCVSQLCLGVEGQPWCHSTHSVCLVHLCNVLYVK